MIYAIADIHGDYAKYCRLLETIEFSSADTLYVLGDVVDRGPHGIQILQDMMLRSNVFPILGNHEFMAVYCLRPLMKEITDDNIAALDTGTLEELQNWFTNGGQSTLQEFHKLSHSERLDILDYLGEFSLYEKIAVSGKNYVLVHAGLGNFSPNKSLDHYAPYDLIFSRPDYRKPYFSDKYVVTGHTPTQVIPGNPRPGRIFRANNHIAIDCGCGHDGPLGAICLDTLEEFYAD